MISFADVLQSNRLVVVVTKFDEFYTAVDESQCLSEEEIKSEVCASVTKATGGAQLPKENVIPICGLWAYTAKQLACNPHNEELQKKARKYLKKYGEAQAEDIPGSELARLLEKASNIALVEKRYVRFLLNLGCA